MNGEMMCTVAIYINRNIPAVADYIDTKLKGKSPSSVILATATTIIALFVLSTYMKKGWGQSRRDQLGNLALRIPYIQKKYAEDIKKQRTHFQESVLKKWASFGEPLLTLPEKGWSYRDLMHLIERYSKMTSDALRDKHFSGTIYSKSLVAVRENCELADAPEECGIEDPRYFELLSKKLQSVFTAAYKESQLWNSLHSDEFAVGAFIDYQAVRIVASMFGGSPNEVMGFVTSGGTESLMLAVRAYRDWGIKNRGHEPGEGVILASESVHAAVLKAGKAYQVEVILLETEENGRMDIEQLTQAVEKYGDRLIAIVGSAPCYPTGIIDPIEAMAAIARDNGCGMHVDCSLGGFIVNNLPCGKSEYLKIPGVTSLSVDTHKNGMAPKGSAVLVTAKWGDENLAYYSIYSVPEWMGGVYGTPKDAGSQSCVQSFNALLALLGTGQNGYQRLAREVNDVTLRLAECLKRFQGKIRLIAKPQVNVVAFKIDEGLCLEKGATYAFAHEMAKRNFVLNAMRNDTAHFCVTVRFASDLTALERFEKAVEESLRAVKELNDDLVAQGKKFSGDAGMYCALEAALTPDKGGLSKEKYAENWLFGRQGANDAIRAYFLAQLDPYASALSRKF